MGRLRGLRAPVTTHYRPAGGTVNVDFRGPIETIQRKLTVGFPGWRRSGFASHCFTAGFPHVRSKYGSPCQAGKLSSYQHGDGQLAEQATPLPKLSCPITFVIG